MRLVETVLIGNRYQPVRKLGQGGMGAVYQVQDRLTGQSVALKRVTAAADQLQFASRSEDQDLRLSLALEFRTLAALRHPHIVNVLDFGFDEDGQPYFTMQLIDHAAPLTDFGRGLPLADKLRLINEMLLALAYLHRRGIIHRDLKPANVLVDAAGGVHVMDFGLALHQTDSVTNMFTDGVGTMAYMAPELFAGDSATVQSDLYAVGLITYELLAGTLPYPTGNIMMLVNSILHDTPDTTGFDAALAAVLDRLLAKDPAQRYASAEAVIDALCEAAHQPPLPENAALLESYLQGARFVGRDDELKLLLDALATLQRGDGSAWLIGGESGVGKSRLVDELRIRALVAGATVLRGQAVEGGGVPFQLWRDPLRRLLLTAPVSDLEAGILQDLVPDIGLLLNRDVPPVPPLTGAGWQQRIILTLVELLKRQPPPLVLLLEDMQWADESLRVIRQVMQVRDQLPPLLLLATFRDDEMPDLPALLPDLRLMSLKRLSPDAIAAMSAAMLGEAGQEPQLVRWLQRETEGNAFFMVEVVRALAEDAGRLANISGMTLPASIVAGGVRQVIARRLARLPELIQRWLKPIAIAGRQLDLAVVDRLSLTYFVQDPAQAVSEQPERDPVTLTGFQSLIEPQRNEFLTLCANAAVLEFHDGYWRFAHDKLREYLLDQLTPAERATLHRRVAVSIEVVYPEDTRFNEVLLQHWSQAGDLDKEMHYLKPVAKKLIDINGAHQEARRLLESGLSRLPADDPRRVGLMNLLADSYLNQGVYDQVSLIARESRALAQSLDDQEGVAMSLYLLGALEDEQGNFPAALPYYEQSLTIRQKLNDQRGIASIFNSLGIIAYLQGDYHRALEQIQQATRLMEAIGDQNGIAAGLNNIGGITGVLGDLPGSREYYLRSLAIKQAVGDQSGIAFCFTNLGILAGNLGNYPEALAYQQDCLKIMQSLGDQKGTARTLNTLGNLAVLTGEYDQARLYVQQGLAIREAINDQDGIAGSLMSLGFVYLNLPGEPARETLRQALTRATAINVTPTLIEMLVGFAWLALRDGNAIRAAELAGLATHHPASHSGVQQRLKTFMPALESALPAAELASALERGKALDLDEVLAGLRADDPPAA